MLRDLMDTSLRKKVFAFFGFIIIGTITGLIIVQLAFKRVQVGGEVYSQIQEDMQIADDVAKARVDFTLIKEGLARLLVANSKADAETCQADVKELRERTDSLLNGIGKGLKDRNLDTSAIEKAQKSWGDFKNILDNDLMPAILDGKTGDAREIMEGAQDEKYSAFLKASKTVVDDVRADVPDMVKKIQKESGLIRLGLLTGGLIFIACLLALQKGFNSFVIRPIDAVSRKSRLMAEGDFGPFEMAFSGRDEIGRMIEDFKSMSARIAGSIDAIKRGTEKVASSSVQLTATAEDLNKGAREQAGQTDQVVAASTEMSQTILDVARNAADAAEAAKNSSETARKGKEVVEETVQGMLGIAGRVKDTASAIEGLDHSSEAIGEILNVINDIADQTNLLALNAAIEAARAGEHGRGFAVVADEVRKLAEKTGLATRDIIQKISGIQKESRKSVEAMELSIAQVDSGVQMAQTASQALDTIVNVSLNAMDMVQRIAAATDEQSSAAEEIAENMTRISGVTTNTMSSTEQIKRASHDLAALVEEMRRHAEWFKNI